MSQFPQAGAAPVPQESQAARRIGGLFRGVGALQAGVHSAIYNDRAPAPAHAAGPQGVPGGTLPAPGIQIPKLVNGEWANAPASAASPAPAPAAPARPDTPSGPALPTAPAAPPARFPAWAQDQIHRGGGQPGDFTMMGSNLVSAHDPAAIRADLQAHPAVTTPAGRALLSPARTDPTPGVLGAAVRDAGAPAAGVGLRMTPLAPVRVGSGTADDYYRGHWSGPGPGSTWVKSQAEQNALPGQWVRNPGNQRDWGDEGPNHFVANPHYGEAPNAYIQGEHATRQQAVAADTQYRINGPEALGRKLDESAATPQRAGVFALSQGQTPGVARDLPGAPVEYNAMNYREMVARDPETASMVPYLTDNTDDLPQAAALFAANPAAADPNGKTRRIFDAHMANLQANPRFDEFMQRFHPTDPTHNWLNLPGRLGFDDGTNAQNQRTAGHMRALGYGPDGRRLLPADAARARLNVRPADY